jgi:hypothetical protein
LALRSFILSLGDGGDGEDLIASKPVMPNLMTEQMCLDTLAFVQNELYLVGVVSGNREGENCKALAKHEHKLVNKIFVAVNCPTC